VLSSAQQQHAFGPTRTRDGQLCHVLLSLSIPFGPLLGGVRAPRICVIRRNSPPLPVYGRQFDVGILASLKLTSPLGDAFLVMPRFFPDELNPAPANKIAEELAEMFLLVFFECLGAPIHASTGDLPWLNLVIEADNEYAH